MTLSVSDNGGTANSGADRSGTQTFAIVVTSENDAPTLSGINTLTGAIEDTAYSISYSALAGAADEADIDGDGLSFRIEAVSTGTLTKGGTPVSSGNTMLASGETILWTPAPQANGTLNAFTVKAWDGAAASSSPVQVQVSVTAVNDAPTLDAIPHQTTLEDANPHNVS